MISKKKKKIGFVASPKRTSKCPLKLKEDECNSDDTCIWNHPKSKCYKKSKRQIISAQNKLSGRYVRSRCPSITKYKDCYFDESCRWNRAKEKCYKKWIPSQKLTYKIPQFYRSFQHNSDLKRFADILEYYNMSFYVDAIESEKNQILVDEQVFNMTNLLIIPEKYRLERLRKMPMLFKEHGIPFEIAHPEQLQTDTPRRVYYKTFYRNNTFLLPKPLFQISFKDPGQFELYTQITSKTGNECFIQTLFSLGLRDVKEGKKDVAKIKKTNVKGVQFHEAAKYFETSFGLQPGQIFYNEYEYTTMREMDDIFKQNLENNFATIFSLSFLNYNSDLLGHFLIVYKLFDTLFYFDPQLNKHYKTLSQLVYEMEVDRNLNILAYGFYETKNITKPIELKNNYCPIKI
jgi:hypothetical protein